MTLRRYLVRRLILSIFILWTVATVNFFVFPSPVANIHLPTSSPTRYYPNPGIEQMLLERYGWFDPLHIKYLKYLNSMFTFGLVPPYFGWSTQNSEFVAEGLSWRLPITVFLLGMALLGVIILGVPIGVLAASRQGSGIDVGLMSSTILTWGIPSFFLQWVAIFFVGGLLRDRLGVSLFSTTWGAIFVPRSEVPLQWWGTCLSQLALPILTLVILGFGMWAVRTRFMVVDALTKDFVLTARAKGLSERKVLYKHAFRSILPQVITLVTLSVPSIVTGSFITEYVFGIQGVGQYLLKSMEMGEIRVVILDPAVVQAVFFVYAALAVLLNFIADLAYSTLDPRIRVGTPK